MFSGADTLSSKMGMLRMAEVWSKQVEYTCLGIFHLLLHFPLTAPEADGLSGF